MLIWLLVNVLLTALALVFVRANRSAPHRFRFHVTVLALVCWLVPWSQLTHVSQWLPRLHAFDLGRAELTMMAKTAAVTQVPLFVIDTRSVPLANEFTLVNIPMLALLALLLTGVVLFGWNILYHHRRLRALRRSALDATALWHSNGIEADVPIYLQQQIGGAFSSGIVEPVVWVHTELATAPELATLLRHELTHIHQHDNAWLLLITLVEKVFWWNPLAWYLGKTARELQELSCDERCQHSDADYPVHLAQLMLANLSVKTSPAQEPLLLSANIFNAHNPDIQRLKVLQRNHYMKPRHIVSAVATAVLAIASVGLVTAQQSTGETRTAEGNVVFVKRVAGSGEPLEKTIHFMMKKDDLDPESAHAQGEHFNEVFDLQGGGDKNQFMKISKEDNGTHVSFKFEDAALQFVLGPLANSLSDQLMPITAVTKTTQPMGSGGPQQVRIRQMGNLRTGNVKAGDFEFEFPVSPQLDLQVDAARTRLVTVSGEDMSLSDALTVISKAANCNIFKDGAKIVIDWCGADPNN